MTDLAFKACYSDWKLIKTRGVVQVVMEVPLAEADAAYKVLGGMPDVSREQWFGVAALKLAQTEKENPQLQPDVPRSAGKRDWRDLQPAAQAGIRCSEPRFYVFLNETRQYQIANEEDAAEAVREICGIKSRVELGTKHAARVLWHQLDEEFLAWLVGERVGA